MAEIPRGSTPTNTITVPIDLTGARVFITYAQDKRVLFSKTGTDITVTSTAVSTELTQEETLKMHEGELEIQIRGVFPNRKAVVSKIIKTTVARILKEGVIEP